MERDALLLKLEFRVVNSGSARPLHLARAWPLLVQVADQNGFTNGTLELSARQEYRITEFRVRPRDLDLLESGADFTFTDVVNLPISRAGSARDPKAAVLPGPHQLKITLVPYVHSDAWKRQVAAEMRGKGELWIEAVETTPVPFTVLPGPATVKCTDARAEIDK